MVDMDKVLRKVAAGSHPTKVLPRGCPINSVFLFGSLVFFFLGSLLSFILVSLLSFSLFGSNGLEREVPW